MTDVTRGGKGPEEVLVGIVTAPDAEAERLAEALVERRLAACCNVISSVTSIFNWEGDRCKEKESLIVVKTTKAVAEELTVAVKELHSYDLPEVIFLSVRGGLEGYLKWVIDECAPGAKSG